MPPVFQTIPEQDGERRPEELIGGQNDRGHHRINARAYQFPLRVAA